MNAFRILFRGCFFFVFVVVVVVGVVVLFHHKHEKYDLYCAQGGSIVDECGILHKTFVSPLIAAPGEVAFAVVSLYKDRLEIAAH